MDAQAAMAITLHPVGARIKITSMKTGGAFVYRITRQKGDKAGRPWNVSAMPGKRYMGAIWPATATSEAVFCRTRNAKVERDAPEIRAFRWYFSTIASGHFPKSMTLTHVSTTESGK
jgi:predicted RNA-binding protein with EMAP domain